jgi:hypothetical protein
MGPMESRGLMKTAVVLGGYGIFGSRVSRGLAETPGIAVRMAGRDPRRGTAFADQIGATFVPCEVDDPAAVSRAIEGADLVVHAAGPFQGRDYRVAEACIAQRMHYLDLADGRAFVCGIGALDAAAREAGVFVGSGASSVPTITWALVEALAPEFSTIDSIHLALSPGNQNPRGAAVIGSILSYLGRPFQVWENGAWRLHHGWGDQTRMEFPPKVGWREVFDCDVPDLDLFPKAWGARTVRFQAGLELLPFDRVLSVLATLRRIPLLPPFEGMAPLCLRVSLWFFDRGSKNGALAAWVRGRDPQGAPIERHIALVTDDDGPATPSSPAILLGRRLLTGTGLPAGARTCMGLLHLDELRAHLEPIGIWCARSDADGAWHRLPPLAGQPLPEPGATATPGTVS